MNLEPQNRISVITPVYNGAKYIEACLQVVIAQNCSQIEHIIMDGNSQDCTVDIVKKYAEKYSRIRLISAPDQGQSDAMNKGITLAKGDIIAILNVDDYYEANVLNRVLELFTDLPKPSLLVGNCHVWDEKGKLKYINKPDKLCLTDLLKGFKINPHPVNPAAYFYHKCLHEEIGDYDLEEDYIMDLDFLFKAVQVANIKYVDETWGNYRVLEGTKSLNDYRGGESLKRRKKLENSYLKKLPYHQSIWIYLRRESYILLDSIADFIKLKVTYFSRHPQELVPSLQKKVKNALRKFRK